VNLAQSARRLVFAGLTLLLAACATRPPEVSDTPWTSGRLSVRVAATPDLPARSVSATFDLRGSGERGELRLSTSLGTLLASARWAPGEAVLSTSQGDTRYDDLDSLSREALGEALPLQALPDWLAGRPWAGAPSQAAVNGFEQLGWQVSLARFAEGWVDADRSAPPRVNVRARLDPAR
jgi:outer membrane lipoprotein LolB